MNKMLIITLAASLATGAASLVQPANAAWPDGPIEFVMPTGPGSGASNEARVFAEELRKPGFLGVPINLVFKKGGGRK